MLGYFLASNVQETNLEESFQLEMYENSLCQHLKFKSTALQKPDQELAPNT